MAHEVSTSGRGSKRRLLSVALAGALVWGHAGVQAAAANADDPDVAGAYRDAAANCAEGRTPGTIGYAINEAVRVHTRIAATAIDTDAMFNDADCFGDLGEMVDLSEHIPSVDAIWGRVRDALGKWAKRKVCSTARNLGDRVLTPVNRTIDDMNQIADLNGLTNGMIRDGMRGLDPELGNVYREARPERSGTYDINRNTVNVPQMTLPQNIANPDVPQNLQEQNRQASDSARELLTPQPGENNVQPKSLRRKGVSSGRGGDGVELEDGRVPDSVTKGASDAMLRAQEQFDRTLDETQRQLEEEHRNDQGSRDAAPDTGGRTDAAPVPAEPDPYERDDQGAQQPEAGQSDDSMFGRLQNLFNRRQ